MSYLLECVCNGEGVFNSSLPCDSTNGQCVCKNHVTGRSCDQCKDGYWNLTTALANGCEG